MNVYNLIHNIKQNVIQQVANSNINKVQPVNTIERPTYTVQRGNSMWQIAHDNNLTLDELVKMNPQIHNYHIDPGDKVFLDYGYENKVVDIKKEEEQEKEWNKDNITAIQHAQHNSNYAIFDKKNNTINVYDKGNNLLYSTKNVSSGKSGQDFNTVTYAGNNGSLENYAGNNSTPAGITKITNIGEYHGMPSFTRARFDPETGKPYQVKGWKKDNTGKWYQGEDLVDDNLASAIHFGDTTGGKNSNGCVRIGGKDIKELAKYLGVGDEIYTLPEQAGSRFTLKGGKLSFVADNPYGNTKTGNISKSGHDMVNWDDYNTHIDKSYSPLVIKPNKTTNNTEHDINALMYANTLSTNKQKLQKQFNLTSNEFNHLAQLAMGIAEQESKFGTSRRYSLKSRLGDKGVDALQDLRNLLKGNFTTTNQANSKGLTQIKYDADIKNQDLKSIYDSLGITKQSLETSQGAAVGTLARLAFIYNTEVKGRKFTGEGNKNIDIYDALLYKYQGRHGQLKNHTATPDKNNYIANVKKYSDNYTYYEIRKTRK